MGTLLILYSQILIEQKKFDNKSHDTGLNVCHIFTVSLHVTLRATLKPVLLFCVIKKVSDFPLVVSLHQMLRYIVKFTVLHKNNNMEGNGT